MHAWIPKQGWFEVADVLEYFLDTDDLGPVAKATVRLISGEVLTTTMQFNLFYNLQG